MRFAEMDFDSVFAPKQLPENRLPSIGDVVSHLQFLKLNTVDFSYREAVSQTRDEVSAVWERASVPIMAASSVRNKVNELANLVRSVIKGSKSNCNRLMEEHALLFDIAACRCKDFGSCKCRKENKVITRFEQCIPSTSFRSQR